MCTVSRFTKWYAGEGFTSSNRDQISVIHALREGNTVFDLLSTRNGAKQDIIPLESSYSGECGASDDRGDMESDLVAYE